MRSNLRKITVNDKKYIYKVKNYHYDHELIDNAIKIWFNKKLIYFEDIKELRVTPKMISEIIINNNL